MKVACISTYLPRECGVATFNQNGMRAMALNLARQGQTGPESGFGVALNDSDDADEYAHGDEVNVVICQDDQKNYIQATTYHNTSDADVCRLEHEFGIFGGESGICLPLLLHWLEKSPVTVRHTTFASWLHQGNQPL